MTQPTAARVDIPHATEPCAIHQPELRHQSALPCPWCVIRELRDNNDALRLSLTASEKRVQELEPAAECWAALAACARIKLMGAASLHPESPGYADPQGHIGLEFWTHHEAKGDAQDINGRDWFCRFMNKALAAYRATGATP